MNQIGMRSSCWGYGPTFEGRTSERRFLAKEDLPRSKPEWQLRPDGVEKVAFLAKRRVRIETAEQNRLTSCHRH
ncbi:hypothetical protein, partial [Novosphingobium fluoreni]|uniref:hypothetical protein n=1 Tax=Novosphingobium fluoreni TaxID=1391222 RepID=UPI001C854119